MDLSIFQAAREAPHRPALVRDGETWSFRETAERVQRALDRLERELADLHPGAAVALVGSSRPSTLVALYALFELGRPAFLLHPRWTSRERQDALRRAGVGGLLELPSDPQGIDFKVTCDSAGESHGPSPPPGVVVFTSGSSGRPRGAALSERALLASARASAANLGWREDDRWLLSLPVAHVGGLSIVTRCLAARRTVVLSEARRFDPRAFDTEVRRHRVTLASLVPTMLRRLLDAEPPWQPPDFLRAFLLGGAPAPPDLLEEAHRRGIPVLTTYGLTEACSQVATQRPGTVNTGALGSGPPLPGVEVRIREGEIQVRGETLMDGYWPPDPGEQPFTDGGWLPTGDLGRLDEDGNLHVRGRRSELLITGGENVHPGEVEAVLSAHPGLAGACVFGVEDREWGQRVAAALVAGPAGPPEDGELLSFLQPRLAAFKRPRQIAYLPALPLLPNGKIDRSATSAEARPVLRPLGDR